MKEKLIGAVRSKTMFCALILQDLVGVLLVSNEFIQSQVSASMFGWYLIALGMIQKILRWVTTTSLDEKGALNEKAVS